MFDMALNTSLSVLQNGIYFLFAEKLSSKGFFSIEMIYFK